MTRYPLANLRVVNFGWVWAAPILGTTLADMGAEVIKIETKKRPDIIRLLPPLLKDQPYEALYAHNTLRNNYGVSLDLKDKRGFAMAQDLVRSADVVIENFSPGFMESLGLGYAGLRKLRPDVVMISLSAAGQTGPLHNIVTYGNIISCLASLDGYQGYIGEDRPMRYGTTIPDPLMGIYGAFAVLTALRHRAKTGKGQYIDLGQWEAGVTMASGPMIDYAMNGRIQRWRGNRDEMLAPHGCYKCAGDDDWLTIAVKTDEEWHALCEVMGREDMANDERYGDLYGRQMHHDAIDAAIREWAKGQEHYAAGAMLQAKGVAAFPALSIQETFLDKHFNARNNWVEVEHRLGRETIAGMPWRLSKTPGGVRRAAPSIGQDNHKIFCDVLGMAPERVTILEQEKVLY
ncbi:MAG: CoA transferase [Chloroflexi bacterium]|nr:CoA transferase [Chloroflexota bacterium]